jgi:hypothetical protein
LIVTRDGNQLSAVIDWQQSFAQLASSQLIVTVAGSNVALPWTDIDWVVLSPALLRTGLEPGLRLAWADGTLIAASSLQTPFGQPPQMVTDSLGVLELPDQQSKLISNLAMIQQSRLQGITRLENLELVSYKHMSESELTYQLGLNRDTAGNPLQHPKQAGFVQFGLAQNASSQAAFRWNGSEGRLLAEVCLARAVGRQRVGDVRCKVLLAKRGKLDVAAEFYLADSRINSEESGCHLLDLPVRGAELIVLVVEKAGRGQWGDQVFWLDARIAE